MREKGFTLAEVLITLAIIGVVAAITIPNLISAIVWKPREVELKKAYLTLENTLQMYKVRNGNLPLCHYWDSNPYGGAKCVSYNANGECSKYEMPDGSNLPPDYNGSFSECNKLMEFMRDNMKLQKYCANNAVANGCMPAYKGNDTVKKLANPDASDYDLTKATSGCGGFREASLKTKMAFVAADGMIFFPYGTTTPIFVVDHNGKNGPNQWGYDLHVFILKGSGGEMRPHPGGCEFVETGGKTTDTLLFRNVTNN